MGFIKVYFINYYYHNENVEPLVLVRLNAKNASRGLNNDVLLHMHPYTSTPCKYEWSLHEVYRKGKYIRNSIVDRE